MTKIPHKIQIVPLGGLGELGKNMTAIRCGDDIVVIDAGLMFPEEEMYGIDLVIPDISYLLEQRDLVRAIILTHGHADHIGALPYIMKHLDVPVYGSRLTLELAELGLKKHGIQSARLLPVKQGDQIVLGHFKAGFISVSHSIPDAMAISLKTPAGTVLHTGDFQFDQTPIGGKVTNYHRLAELGDRGVLVMLADSANAERVGYNSSAQQTGQILDEAFRAAQARIITTAYSSNINRIQQILDTACKYGRRVAAWGDSGKDIMAVASEFGYLEIPQNILIDVNDIANYPGTNVVILLLENHGEPWSVLTKVAAGEQRKLAVMAGDTIVIPAASVPGTEKLFSRIVDQLLRQGAEVITEARSSADVSGHASQEELKFMHNLIRPKFFIPIHGEYRQLVKHSRLAQDLGMAKENIFVADNGTVLELSREKALIVGKVAAGNILVDGLGVGDVGNIVLRDRRQLSQDGILILIVTLDKECGAILAGPDIVSRGFVYIRESEQLIEDARERVKQALDRCVDDGLTEWSDLKSIIRDTLGKYLYEKTRRRPMILPIIMEV